MKRMIVASTNDWFEEGSVENDGCKYFSNPAPTSDEEVSTINIFLDNQGYYMSFENANGDAEIPDKVLGQPNHFTKLDQIKSAVNTIINHLDGADVSTAIRKFR